VNLLRDWTRRVALGWWDAVRLATAVGGVLCLSLFLFRGVQLASAWPHPGDDLWAELPRALLMGLRFDAKAAAVAAFVLWPLLCVRGLVRRLVVGVWVGTFGVLAVTNHFYYQFYKTPIDSVIFGLVDDDTTSVLLTILLDFPVLQIALMLAITLLVMAWPVRWLMQHLEPPAHSRTPPLTAVGLSLLCLVIWVLAGKGTLKGMALQLDNVTATSKPVLNHTIPNGVMSLYFAWNAYKDSSDVGDDRTGLRAHGFESPQQAAQVLGASGLTDDASIARWLVRDGTGQPRGQHLVFVQMESWSAEPLMYQSPRMDVAGSLAPVMEQAWHFRNFDAAHVGTHPALETLLLGTPITPITTGQYRHIPFEWSLAHVLKRAGYDTLFVTSGHTGWRELNRVLPTQGFDEVVDAATLRAHYGADEGGLWGVWDEYLFRYIAERLHDPQRKRPLFVYAMPTTHHPPYELPATYRAPDFQLRDWPGERSDESLIPSLKTYRYANEQLAAFVQAVQHGPKAAQTLIAATGDHTMRTTGQVTTPSRRVLQHRVPFMVWGAGPLACRAALDAPASHLDIFPTLLPLLGVEHGYLHTGRNLTQCDTSGPSTSRHAQTSPLASFAPTPASTPMALSMLGGVRTAQAIWQVGQPNSLGCINAQGQVSDTCRWSDPLDQQARARLGLLDWHVRRHLNLAMRNAPSAGAVATATR
jgi:phosphoglycerol transferase MdoB-like AlkP superfamily enzyme